MRVKIADSFIERGALPYSINSQNSIIYNNNEIGDGAIIKQGTRDKPLVIGEGSTIGMGAVVTKDVEPYTTVFGNTAKPYLKSLEKNDS